MIFASDYFKNRFGHKMYKASISLDVTCPNRDGSKSKGGCIFCSAGGSGEFSERPGDVNSQIDAAIERVKSKAGENAGYIAYFQSFTNTYCTPEYLDGALAKATSHPAVEALSIATRPDCLPEEILAVIGKYASRLPVFVELGLQTASDKTAEKINRCYETEEYKTAVSALHAAGANVITHIIFGLPEETEEDMMDTVRYAVSCGTDGVKFTCLYVLKDTPLEQFWREGKVEVLEQEEYFEIVARALELLPAETVVHRLTGDGPKSLLLAPMWTADKRQVVNYINRRFKR